MVRKSQPIILFLFICKSISFADITVFGKISSGSFNSEYPFKKGKVEIQIIDSGISNKTFKSKINKDNSYSIKIKGNYQKGKMTVDVPHHKKKSEYIDLTSASSRIMRNFVLEPTFLQKESKISNKKLIVKEIKISESPLPESSGITFTNDVGLLYCHTLIDNKTKSTKKAVHEWYYKNQLVSKVMGITIPESVRNQRDFSKRIISPNQIGNWLVRVEIEGEIYAVKSFKIVEKLLNEKVDVDIVEHTRRMRSKYGGSEHSDRMLASEKEQADYSRKLNRKQTNYSLQREEKFNKERNIKSKSESQKNKLKKNKPSNNDKVQANKTNLKSRSKLNSKNKDKEPDPWNLSDDLIFYNLIVHQEQSWHGCSSVNKCYQIIGDEYYKTPNEIKNIAFRGLINNWKTP